MQTVTNFTRFIHDGNDPILPDEEDGGRIAQTLCNPYWKTKYSEEDDFVQYNIELGAHIKNKNVQLLLYYMLLKLGCPERFSFHTINKCTGAFAKQERKHNRSLLEKFLVYLCEEQQWFKKELQLYESDDRSEEDKRNGISPDTIEYYLTNWARHQHFEQPVKCRTITTLLGKWVAMKHGGVRHCREWIANRGKHGPHTWVFDLVSLRNKFALEAEKRQAEADAKEQSRKRQRTEGQTALDVCSECECTCDDHACQMNDEQLLQAYINQINHLANKGALDHWIATKERPMTWQQEDEAVAAEGGDGANSYQPGATSLTWEQTEAFVMGYRDDEGLPLTEEYSDDKAAGWITRAFYSTILYGANCGDPHPTFEDGTINMYKTVRRLLRQFPNYVDQHMPTFVHNADELAETPYNQYLE
jgi:hypothetical protein